MGVAIALHCCPRPSGGSEGGLGPGRARQDSKSDGSAPEGTQVDSRNLELFVKEKRSSYHTTTPA